MDKNTLKELAEQLTLDPEVGIILFRQLFGRQLHARHFQNCWSLLETLHDHPNMSIQHIYFHYKGVLLFDGQRNFDQAEQIWRRLLNEPDLSPIQQARTANALGILLGGELGQWDEAAHYYQLAVQRYGQAEDSLGLVRVYNNLGIMHTYRYEQGAQEKRLLAIAQEYHQQAIQLCQRLLDEQGEDERFTAELARNWHGMGRVLALQAHYQPAMEAFEQLFVLCDQDSQFERAAGLSDQAALIYTPQGDLNAAEHLLTEAIALFREENETLYLIEAMTRLGNVYAKDGYQLDLAEKYYEDAVQYAETMRQKLMTEGGQVRYRDVTDFVYTAPVTLYLQQQDASAALTASEVARSRVLVDLLLGSQNVVENEQLMHLRRQRDALQDQLEVCKLTSLDAEKQAGIEAELRTLERQIELETATDLVQVDALNEAEIRALLPSDSVLLTYVSDADKRFHVLVTTSKRVVHIPLSAKLKLDWLHKMLIAYLDGVRKGLVPTIENDQLLNLQFFSNLYQVLVEPILPYLDGVKTLYIVPTGPLNYIPIGSLTPSLHEASPLLVNHRVVYAPSATTLFRYCHRRPYSLHHGLATIAPTEADLHLSQAAAMGLAQCPSDKHFVDQAASAQTFLTQAGNYRIICFLGHALFNAQYPMHSYLKLNDRNLRASEMLHELQIDADLVVLAACETGRSQILRGDEILGLSRAILRAGTPALLVTAWKVHELSTRLFVEHFFTTLRKIEQERHRFDPASALAAAQNWLRTLTYSEASACIDQWPDMEPTTIEQHLEAIWHMQKQDEPLDGECRLFAHPFFWAPYMLIGEPSPQIEY